MTQPVCAIIGVGPGNGEAFAKKFTEEGYRVALLSRNEAYLKGFGGPVRRVKGLCL